MASIVTLGAPPWHPWLLILHVFRTWLDLGAQFGDSWAPSGRPWGPFWCIFTALGPDPGPLAHLFLKRLETNTKKERKRELEWSILLQQCRFVGKGIDPRFSIQYYVFA